jgi:curli production assembly/transport component CsgE
MYACLSATVLLLIVLAGPVLGQTYPDELTEIMVEDSLAEGLMDEDGAGSIIIDMTRTKIGRDFYDSFYEQWSRLPVVKPAIAPRDSIRTNPKLPPVLNLTEFVISIEELPTPGNGLASIVSIMIDNQIVWQQFVPVRRDQIDDYALDAVAAVQAYIADLQSVSAQLGDGDQRGTGVY